MYVSDGVQQEVRAAIEAGGVDDGSGLPDRDRLGLGAVDTVPGEWAQLSRASVHPRDASSARTSAMHRILKSNVSGTLAGKSTK